MRRLLNTLFVVSEDSYLALENKNAVILRGEECTARFPLMGLENIIYFGYRGASPALMGACAESGVSLSFFNPGGKFLARVHGQTKGNVLLRKKQVLVSECSDAALQIAKNMILGKVHNSRWVLERATRDHGARIDVKKVKQVCTELSEALQQIAACENVQTLRGFEGEAAVHYFSAINELILHNKDAFFFTTRSRRPPMDAFNALLSFAYALLTGDCVAALEGVGLDPYIGFLHVDRPGRVSLALDLMEELRSNFADRFVLTLINNRIIQPSHFKQHENRWVRLTDGGRKIFLNAWQERKRDELKHPYLNEKIHWGLVPHTQALLLARFLRGDLEQYPPFFWK